jgi:hypothetical protein
MPFTPARSEAMSSVLSKDPSVRVINILQMEAVVQPHRQTVLRTAEFEDPRDGRRFRVGYSRQKNSNYYSPPHRHTFDQIRFIVSGKVKYGPLRLNGGDVAYFPEGVFYGPTEPLSEEVTTCTIQTQGPTWGAFPTDAECAVAAERLKGSGTMDRASGEFVWNDGRRQDSFEAMLENLEGGPAKYPKDRYRAPVQIKTESFEWLPTRDAGVRSKGLARFNAAGPELELLQIAPGAVLPGSSAPQHRMLVVFSGDASYQGKTLSESSYLYCPPWADVAPIEARTETVIFSARFEARVPRSG